MGQVLDNMRRWLPAVAEALTQINALRGQLKAAEDNSVRQELAQRLDHLCVGRAPEEAAARLREFQEAVEAGEGLKGVSLWVNIGPLLRRKES